MRFLVVGEALVDLVQSRTDGRFTAHAGGSPFNVAVTLARLGQAVSLVGQCGEDSFGRLLTARLREVGVRLDCWRELPLPSSLAVATLSGRGEAGYSFYFDNTAGLAFDDAAGRPAGLAFDDAAGRVPADVVHAGSIASWLPPAADRVADALVAARSGGRTLVSYDPNARPALITDWAATRARVERCVSLAHVVKASDEDVAALYDSAPVDEVAARWCSLGASLVVVTLGGDGAVAFDADGALTRCAPPRIAVADTVGAGDSFAGGLLAGLAGEGLAEPGALADALAHARERFAAVVRSAVTVASITCERPGADPPTEAELAARLAPGRDRS